MVNQTEIGYWSAVRKEPVMASESTEEVVYRYECEFEIYERGAWKGSIFHAYSAGAVVLLARLADEASHHIPRL